MTDFRLIPAGDSALIVEFEERIDPAVNRRVVRFAGAVEAARIGGVRDVVPTFRSVAVFFDPLRTEYAHLTEFVEQHARQPAPSDDNQRAPHRVPVCYGGDLGPDLEAVAGFARMPVAEVVSIHASRTYRVFMLGFLPGFAYMASVDTRIAAPRLATPRPRVPRGSVGIAGMQTGIYPADTPGGWQIIGRSPLKPFDLSRPRPFLFEAGDAVHFVPIDRAEYDRLENAKRQTKNAKEDGI
jgi:inhibitor of KinA